VRSTERQIGLALAAAGALALGSAVSFVWLRSADRTASPAAPKAPPVAPTSPASPAVPSPPSPGPVWRVKRGDRVGLNEFRWRANRTLEDGTEREFDLRLTLDETVQAVSDDVVTMRARITRLRVKVAGGAVPLDLDSDVGLFGVEHQRFVGRDVTYRFEASTGRVRMLLGLSTATEALIEGTSPLLRQVMERALAMMRDKELQLMLSALLCPLAEDGASAERSWEAPVWYYQSRVVVLGEVVARGAGGAVTAHAEALRVRASPGTTRITEPALVEQAADYAGGRLVQSRLRLTFRVDRPDERSSCAFLLAFGAPTD
jgi:hypothetical protein